MIHTNPYLLYMSHPLFYISYYLNKPPLTLFHQGWDNFVLSPELFKYLENGTGRHSMTFWLLAYIYFEILCHFWQSFTSFWGSYEDFVETPQNCAKIKKFWIISIFLLWLFKIQVALYIYIYIQIYIYT